MNRMVAAKRCFLFFFMALPFLGVAQSDAKMRIDLQGTILDAEDLQPVQNVNVYVHHRFGTTSNVNGYFNLPCYYGDTVIFSFVGYRMVKIAVVDSVATGSQMVGVILHADTVMIQEVVVLPFISYEQLKYEVAHMQSEAELQTAFYNVASAVNAALTMPATYQDDAPVRQLASYTSRLEYAGMFNPSKTLSLIGTNEGLIRYIRQIGKRNTRPSTPSHQKQLQMAADVRKFVKKQKEESDE